MLNMAMIKTFFLQILAIIMAILSLLCFGYFKGKKSVQNDINRESLKTMKRAKKDYEKDRNAGVDSACKWLHNKSSK